MGMVLLQLVLNENGEEEGGNEADTLGHSNLPGCSLRLTVVIDVRRPVKAYNLDIEGYGDLLRHYCDPRAHKV